MTLVNVHPRPRCLVAVLMFLLAVLLPGLLATAAPDAAPAQAQAATIGVVANLPKKSHDLLLESLKQYRTGFRELSAVQFDYLCTMDDLAEGEAMLARDKARPFRGFIFLDTASAAAFAGRTHAPWIAIAASRATLPAAASPAGWLIETTPPAALIARVLAGFKPVPAAVGVAYIKGDAFQERLVAELGVALKQKTRTPSALALCPLPGAPCNNANAIQGLVQSSLARLPQGGLLLVLPGNNTLKYPFVFEQFVRERRLLLMGLGEFDSGAAPLHLGVTPALLARACLETLAAQPASAGQAPVSIVTPSHLFRYDRDALKGAGCAIQDGQLKPGGGLELAETTHP